MTTTPDEETVSGRGARAGVRPTVLIIDDDEQMRSFVRDVLAGDGMDVDEATDGARGVARFHLRQPDLVICDIYMPDQEGLETIWELRRLCPGLPIIAMSGGGAICRLNPLPQATRLGAAAALTKPFSEQELLSAVRRALGR